MPRRSPETSTLGLLWDGLREAFVPAVCWFLGLAAVGVVAGALFIGTNRHGGWLTTYDAHVNRWFGQHHTAWAVSAGKGVAMVCSVPGLVIIAVVVGLVLWWVGWRVRAFVPLAAVLLAELIVFVVKEIIASPRPPTANGPAHYPWVHGVHETDFSFPSGHSTGTAALVVALAVLAVSRGARWWPWFVALVLAAAVATSRLVLGVHWFSDVATGLCLGAVWGGAVASVLREPGARARTGPPPVPS